MSASHHQPRPAALPVDPDVLADRPGRPAHLRLRYLYVVALGGALGALSHDAVNSLVSAGGGWPIATLTVNLAGAFALGVLLRALIRRGPDRGWRRLARLHFGTGFLGAFTTYSALAVEVVLAGRGGQTLVALGYPVLTLLLGAMATLAGIGVADRRAEGTSR